MKIKYLIISFILVPFFIYSCEKEADDPSDADGNVYKTVTLGTQVWMAENLKTTKYSNGDLISTTDPATKDIRDEVNPKYQWASAGQENIVADYGRLYTWSVVTDSRNVCPTGWHVPTDAEWVTLNDFLVESGYGIENDKNSIAKAMADKSFWHTVPEEGSIYSDQSNNRSGFSAVPNGDRYDYKDFAGYGYFCSWWTTTETGAGYESNTVFYRGIYSTQSTLLRLSSNKDAIAFGVRCLKDK
jgi:uncharacterized protein (TIGR02145 family)